MQVQVQAEFALALVGSRYLRHPRGKIHCKQCQLGRRISKSSRLIDKVQVRNSSSVLRAVHLQVQVQVRTLQKHIKFQYSSAKVWALALKK